MRATGALARMIRCATATLVAILAACAFTFPQPAAADPPQQHAVRESSIARHQHESTAHQSASEIDSPDVRDVARWAVASDDNRGLPYLVVDKVNARLFAFSASGNLLGETPVLVGSARGDHTVPGIGEREISQIRPHERTTPAGRFVAERGRNLAGEDIVWVDYDAAVSLHRVRGQHDKERRLDRLATPTAADNRITYGCINVPVRFYNAVINAIFATSRAVVYVLPEMQPAHKLFGFDAPPMRIARPAP